MKRLGIIGGIGPESTVVKTTFMFSTHDPRVMAEAEIVFRLEDGRLVSREVTGAAA